MLAAGKRATLGGVVCLLCRFRQGNSRNEPLAPDPMFCALARTTQPGLTYLYRSYSSRFLAVRGLVLPGFYDQFSYWHI